MNGYDAPVGIVGAGPVGLTCALRLAVAGIRCIVLESEMSLVPQGSKACLIQGDVVEVLDKVGCGERIGAEGIAWTVARTYVKGTEIEKTVYQTPLGFGPFVNISQYRIEQLLLDRIGSEPGCDVRWSHPVTGLDQDDAGVTVRAGDRTLRFRYLVACDGIRSTVRELTNARWTGKTYGDRFLITDIKADLQVARERHFHYDPPFNPGRQLVMHAQPSGIWRIDWQLPPDADIDDERRTGALDRRIRDVIGDIPYEIKWLSTYRFHQRVVDRFRIGDVFFAGDAAHALPPYGARGMNSGIQDADNLAWKLALVLDGRSDPALLDSYHPERHAAAEENLRVTQATIEFMVPRSRARRIGRRMLLAGVSAARWLRRWVDSGTMAEPFVYRRSPIVDRSTDDPLNGRFAPDRAVIAGGAPTRLRRFFGSRFVLLAVTGDPTGIRDQAGDLPADGPQVDVVVLVTKEVGSSVAGQDADVVTDTEPGSPYRAGRWYLVRPDGHVAAGLPLTRINELPEVVRRSTMTAAVLAGHV